MTRLVRIEFSKLETMRLTYGVAAVAAVLTALFALLENGQAGAAGSGVPPIFHRPRAAHRHHRRRLRHANGRHPGRHRGQRGVPPLDCHQSAPVGGRHARRLAVRRAPILDANDPGAERDFYLTFCFTTVWG